MTLELAFLCHILLTAAGLWIWFQSDFPVYLTKFLRTRGWLPKSPDYWPDDLTFRFWLRHEWEAWVTLKNPTLAHLLSCPVCFATRLAMATSVWTAAWTGQWLVIPFFAVSIPVACSWLKLMSKPKPRASN
jgi:hypothetical protein